MGSSGFCKKSKQSSSRAQLQWQQRCACTAPEQQRGVHESQMTLPYKGRGSCMGGG